MLRGLPREQTAVTVLSLICCAAFVVLLLLLSYPLTSDCTQYKGAVKTNMGLADVVTSCRRLTPFSGAFRKCEGRPAPKTFITERCTVENRFQVEHAMILYPYRISGTRTSRILRSVSPSTQNTIDICLIRATGTKKISKFSGQLFQCVTRLSEHSSRYQG